MSNPKFKMGDHVRVKATGRTGTVKTVYDAYTWGMWTGFSHEYSVDLDDGSGAVTLIESVLEFSDETLPIGIKCECGVASVGQGKHSDYCPLFDPSA